jgi:hypothetical protein
MTNLNELVVKNRESDTEYGFFFVEFENGKSLQCCLVSKQDNCDDEPYFVDAIEIDNSGYNDGICGDVNEWASEDGEWSHIEEFLIEQARKYGVSIAA